MKPGVYDISIEDYHASDGISRSGIVELKKSPLHYFDKYLSNEKAQIKRSPSLEFGDLVHTLLLEEDKFGDRFIIAPPINKNTKQYKDFTADHTNKTVIDLAQYDAAIKIQQSIGAHPIASKFINSGQIEKSIYWIDEDSNVLCKSRPDVWLDNIIVDLKTTQCASKEAFQRSVYSYNYHIQAAMCLDASASTGKPYHSNFVFIAIEKERPYAVAVYVLQDEAIECGRKTYKRLLEVFAECNAKNEWPGYSVQIEDINLPNYVFF